MIHYVTVAGLMYALVPAGRDRRLLYRAFAGIINKKDMDVEADPLVDLELHYGTVSQMSIA